LSNLKRDEPVIIIRKKGGKHDHYHGGSWKVAYADFVTAMMAFFLVMWIMGMSEGLRDVVQGYFQDPLASPGKRPASLMPLIDGGQGREGGGDSAGSQYGVFLGIAQALRSGFTERGFEDLEVEVEISISDDGLRIELMETSEEDLFFQTGSAVVRPTLVSAMAVIGRDLNILQYPMVIEGHTDTRPFVRENATSYGNWELSVDRANAVRRTLMEASEGRIQVREVRGYADQFLRIPGDPEAPQNRRVSLFIPFLRELPDNDAWEINDLDNEGGGWDR
jgi:chemotaxis protein MotB